MSSAAAVSVPRGKIFREDGKVNRSANGYHVFHVVCCFPHTSRKRETEKKKNKLTLPVGFVLETSIKVNILKEWCGNVGRSGKFNR